MSTTDTTATRREYARYCVNLERAQVAALGRLAEEQERSVSSVVRRILADYFAQQSAPER